MGLLSFLSRKSSSFKAQHEGDIISQAYHSTTACVPPVRGQYPIGGNGSRSLKGLEDYHGLGQSQLRIDLPSPDEEAAPAPVVPTFRDESIERPITAPNARPLTGNRLNTSKTRVRRSLLSGHLPLTSSKSDQDSLRGRQPLSRTEEVNPAGRRDLVGYQQRPHTARQRSNPVLNVSGTGFKDILDAQSEFKPLDFRSRVKASGARDYGEDVADRNIGENGHNLELPQVQAFYAQSPDSASLRSPRSASMANMSRPYQRDVHAPSIRSQPTSLESGLRRNSLNSSAAYKFQNQRASRVPELDSKEEPGVTGTSNQRPMTSDAIPQRQMVSQTQAKQEVDKGYTSERSKLRRLAYRGGPPLPMSPLRNSVELDPDETEFESPDKGLASPSMAAQVHGTGISEAIDHGQVPLSELNSDAADQAHDQKDGHRGRPASSQRSFPLKPSTKRRSGKTSSVASSMNGYTTHSVKPSVASSVASYHTAIDYSTSRHPPPHSSSPSTATARRASLPASHSHQDNQSHPEEPAPLPPFAPNTLLPSLSSIHDPNHLRTKSLTSTLAKLDTSPDVPKPADPVPPRTSSIRNWSISSTTPTTDSSTSSNSFQQRPQSRNTASTSVDLGKDFTILPQQPTTTVSHPDPSSETTTSKPRKSITFNIDDYISSDSDSDSLEPRIPRGEGEEGLLFSTSGYGSFQLPGLSDTLASSPPLYKATTAVFDDSFRPTSSASLPAHFLHHHQPFFTQAGSVSPRRRYVLDTAADSDSDVDEGHEVQSYRHTRRLSALGAQKGPVGQDVIEEERDWDKTDLQTTGREKEAKGRKRASTTGSRLRRTMKGKERAVEVVGTDRDEGWADGEKA